MSCQEIDGVGESALALLGAGHQLTCMPTCFLVDRAVEQGGQKGRDGCRFLKSGEGHVWFAGGVTELGF